MTWAEASQQPALRIEKEAMLSRLTMATPATDDYSLREETVGSLRIASDTPTKEDRFSLEHKQRDSSRKPPTNKKPQICRGRPDTHKHRHRTVNLYKALNKFLSHQNPFE